MKHELYRKLAIGALVSVIILIFVGATVRVTGAGMGCPDWPSCWGLLIPPTDVSQVDFDQLPIEKFQRKAERMGRDPATITREALRADFNPRHVWTEFLNRLTSLPVGFFTLATFIVSFSFRKSRPLVFWLSFAALGLVLTNAWMGARVVYSGISPGVLTTHLTLAMLLICVLVYCVWAAPANPRSLEINGNSSRHRLLIGFLLFLIVTEGVLGSQIREMTDQLAKAHLDAPRSTWTGELEQSLLYLIHRSFSWVILAVTACAYHLARKTQNGPPTPSQTAVAAIVVCQMLLGFIMARIHIYSWVQVLHVGFAAILLACTFRWFLLLPKKARLPEQADLQII